MSQNNKPKIIYVFDPMCGWCYGFSKVMHEFKLNFEKDYDFEIISGGMVLNEREGPIGDFADYILGAYPRVEALSGVVFGKPYLDALKTKQLWTGSSTPAIAIEAFKKFNALKAIEFAALVQKAYYFYGKDLRDTGVYLTLIKQFNVSENDFLSSLRSEEMRKAAYDGYQQAANYGVTGYPTVIMVWKDKYYLVAKGFTNYQQFVKTIDTVKSTY
jgi:putative protein-disulfide isomerase